MLFTTALCLFMITWSSLFLIDFVLRALPVRRYVVFAEKHDFQISPFQLRFYTHKYDPRLAPGCKNETEEYSVLCRVRQFLVRIWFDLGVVVALTCSLYVTWYLSNQLLSGLSATLVIVQKRVVDAPRPLHQRIFQSHPDAFTHTAPTLEIVYQGDADRIDHPIHDEGLTPIVPGMNMPWGHVPIFMLVLIIAAVLHELGHAWAARFERIRVSGFGVFVLGIYPGAFTEIDNLTLDHKPVWGKLRVYCGGVWHNLVLAAIGVCVVYSTPYLMAPLFTTGRGVTVEEVSRSSGLFTGLFPGNIITKIDHCQIYNPASWTSCVRRLKTQQYGRCVDTELVQLAQSTVTSVYDNEIHCCSEKNSTPTHICFENIIKLSKNHKETRAPNLADTLRLGEFDKPREVIRVESRARKELSCLDARQITEMPLCNSTTECSASKDARPTTCVFPALYNGTRLVRIEVEKTKKPVLFVGKLDEFLYFVEISAFVARWRWVPRVLPHTVELIGKYIVTLSVALGVLNAVPCFALDGQHVVVAIMQSFKLPRKRRRVIVQLVLGYGTFLLVANVVIGFVRFFRTFNLI